MDVPQRITPCLHAGGLVHRRLRKSDEIDRWEAARRGGAPGQWGSLTDKFGVSLQILPRVIPEITQSGDANAIERAMRAVVEMKKLDAAKIRQAYEAG